MALYFGAYNVTINGAYGIDELLVTTIDKLPQNLTATNIATAPQNIP